MTQPLFNPYDPAFHADRHGVYDRIRREAPILPMDMGGHRMWLLTRHADIGKVVRNPGARVKGPGQDRPPRHFGDGAAAQMWRDQLVLMDGSDHARLRKLAMPAFRPERLRALGAGITSSIRGQLDQLAGAGEIDAVANFAAFVPATTILHVLGLPTADWEPLLSRVPDFVQIFSPFPLDEVTAQRTNDACAFYLDYFGNLVDERSKTPGDDIVGDLITAHEDGDRLSRGELIAMLHAFLNAGYETTMSVLGSGLYGLLSHQRSRASLVADPAARAADAFEETLRWEAPVHFVNRYLDESLVLDDGELPAGEPILLGLAAGNRDPARFANPDVLDIDRTERDLLTFGGGRHFCIGAQLARLEARLALRELFSRFPDLSLADDAQPPRQASLLFPAIKALPVRLGARAEVAA